MRWPFKHKPDHEAAEKAKQELAEARRQLEVAKVLQESARDLRFQHEAIVAANHFGPSVAAALREGPRRT
jgi:hypothetical protein